MIPYEFDAERFSRWMSYVLRHNPTRYGLQPDRHGYVDLEAFFLIARRRYPDVAPEQLRHLIEGGGSGRFEISNNRLRARYGHSIPIEPAGSPVEPPQRLYHGTEATHTEAIVTQGLQPMGRRLIHLSETVEDAIAVAMRKTPQPIVIRVLAAEAHIAGIVFYREGRVYLTAHIPAQFVALESIPAIFHPPATS